MANDRVYQVVVEVVVLPSSGSARTYQEVEETAVLPETAKARAYQEVAEAAVLPETAKARAYQEPVEVAVEALGSGLVTQLTVETLATESVVPARVTQIVVETLATESVVPVLVTQVVVEALFTMRTRVAADLLLDQAVAHTVGGNLYLRNIVHADLEITSEVRTEVGANLEIDSAYRTTVGKELVLASMISGDEHPPRVQALVKVDGVDITGNVMFERSSWTMHAGPTPGTGEVWVYDPDHTISFVTGMETTLDIGGLRAWGGYVMGIRRAFAFEVDDTEVPAETARFLVLEVSDYNILFQKRYIFNKDDPTLEIPLYSAWKYDSAVIKKMVEKHLDLTSDGIDLRKIDHVGSPNEEYEGASYAPGETWAMAMTRTAQLPGAIFYIDPDKVLNYADVDIADAPFALSDQPTGTTTVGYSSVEILMDGANLCNDAMVWGAGIALDRMTFKRVENEDSIAEHGLWQWADFRKDLWRPMSVERRARTYVEGSDQNKRGHKDDAVSIRCTVWTPGLRAGMRARFINVAHGYDDVIPIRSMRFTFINPSEARYDLELSHLLDDAWNTAEFLEDTVRVCEAGTPGTVTTPVPTQAGLYVFHGRHTWQTTASNYAFFSGSGDVGWPGGELDVRPTIGPIEPIPEIHHLQQGQGEHPDDFRWIDIHGDGVFDIYLASSMLTVIGAPVSATMELKVNGVPVASVSTSSSLGTNLRIWGWMEDTMNIQLNDYALSAGDRVGAYLSFSRMGLDIPYGDYALPWPALPQGDRLTIVGTAVMPGGLTLSQPYVAGSVKAFDANGNEIAVTEVNPAAGTVLAPGSTSVCYDTVVGSGDGWADGTNPDGGGGIVLPPPPGGDVYRPHHRKQLGWGTALDGSNCTMASACIALDRHTEGAKMATPPQMRAQQYDQSGGADLNDAKIAWANGWGETLRVRYSISWQTFVSNIREGRGGILQGMYRKIPRQYSCQYGSDFGHAIYVNEINDDSMALVYDPLCTGPKWIPISVLELYGESFTGGNSVHAAFTRRTS